MSSLPCHVGGGEFQFPPTSAYWRLVGHILLRNVGHGALEMMISSALGLAAP
jgi:hypothetical protein